MGATDVSWIATRGAANDPVMHRVSLSPKQRSIWPNLPTVPRLSN